MNDLHITFDNLVNLTEPICQAINSHLEIMVEKKSDSPDEDKSVHDARVLIPTLIDFFKKHPVINPKTFLGDAALDSVALYKELLSDDTFAKDRHFSKAYIPLNSKLEQENPDYTINADDLSCCSHSEELIMKYEGTSKLKSGVIRYKFVYPMIK